MEKVTLSFSAKGQSLRGCLFRFASNTVNYIEAKFDLGENWGGFDSVRAVWFTDFNCISTVLDTDGVCVVPHEVLNKAKREVKVNLVGSIVEDGELTDRLTTYPIKAIIIDANAKICGSETAEVTPSQFEQYVEAVKAEVAKIKDIDSVELNDDYTLTIYFSDGTETTIGPIRGEQGPAGPAGPQGETGNGIASIDKTGTAGSVDTYTITFTDGTTTTFEVRNGEVSLDTLESLMPVDTASGDIASFPDGQGVFPAKSLKVSLEPIQDLSHGAPSPDNICPISGHDEVDVSVVGVNQWDEEWELGNIYSSTGQNGDSTTTIRSTNYIPIKPNTQYYVKIPTVIGLRWYAKDKSYIEPQGVSTSGVVTTPNNAYYLRFVIGLTTYNNDISINYPSTDHDYHAYNGQTYTTTLPSTTYGGTLDVVSGELTVDRGGVLLNGQTGGLRFTEVSQATTADGTKYVAYIPVNSFGMKLNNVALCDSYDFKDTPLNNLHVGEFNAIGSYMRFVIADRTLDTLAKWNAYLANNPMQLVYELATPTTYQLTAQQIQTLVGVNNVWSEQGEVETTYVADIQKYILKTRG